MRKTSINIWGLVASIFLVTTQINAQVYTWDNVNFQGMGYVTGIAIHPTTYDKYVRTDVGGVFRWDNTNSKWLPVTDGKIASYNVEGMALSASNSNVVFIAVGNKETGKLYKSTDKGNSWQQYGNFSAYVAGNDIWRNTDPRLVVDANNNGNLMFYASRKSGLQKSTDGGLNWTSISSSVIPYGTEASGGQNFVIIDKASGNTTTSSTTVYVGVAGQGVYKSTNGGTSFTLLSGGPATTYFPVCADISSTGILYVTYTTAWDGGSGLVYKYSTSGVGTNITPSPTNGSGFAGIDVSNSDPNKIITFTWKWGWLNNGVQGIHYSTDGGTSWSAKSFLDANINDPAWWHTADGLMYTWCGGVMFDPQDNNKVWFTHGYGVMTARDITVTNPVYDFPMKGLEELVILQVFSAPSPNTTSVYVAAADIRGFRATSRDQVPSTALDNGSFGMTSCFDYCPADPNFVVRVGDGQYYWQSPGWGYKSTDGGATWTAFASKPTNAAHGNIAVSATDKNRLVWAPMNFSGCGWNVLPYYSTNGGSNWTAVSGIPAGDNDCTEEWSASKFLAADRVNGSKFYYYTYTGGTSKFYRSTNGGQTFSQVTGVSLPGNYKMKMEAIPGKEGNLLLCTSNGSSLYRTTDGGTSWSAISGVTTAYRFGFGKPISPSTEPTIFINGIIGGVNGIYYSTNQGSSWTRIWDGSVPAGCLDITGDMKEEYTVYLATSGRGVIYGTAQSPTVAVTGVSVAPSTASINVGSTQQLTATVAPSNATNKTVSWSSSNTSVATVNSNGLVTGVAVGTATITVTTQDGNKTATSAITVSAASSSCTGNLLVNPGFENGLTGWGDWGNFYTSTIAANGVGAAYVGTWSGGFYQQLTVIPNTTYTLKVNAKIEGNPTQVNFGFEFFSGTTSTGVEVIGTVTSTSYTEYVLSLQAPANANAVTVWVYKTDNFGGSYFDDFCFTAATSSVPVTGVTVTPTSATLNTGATQQLTATVAPSNATNKTVSWSSSNTSVATVNAIGLVTGVAAGTATVTATTQDGNKTATCTITVTATCSLPSGWSTSDIGSVSPAGSACASGTSFTVKGAGADIWGTADAFRFAYTQVSGDYTIIAKVNSMTNTNSWAKAGVMIRETLNTNSKNAFMAITPGNGATFQIRTTAGGSSTSTVSAGKTAPYWVKITRGGNSLKGYISTNGTTWTLITTKTVTMTTNVYIGLAVTSHANGTLCTAEFSDVSVQSGVKSTEIENQSFTDETIGFSDKWIRVYPNPSTHGLINIELNNIDNGIIQINDTNGRMLKSEEVKSNRLTIETSGMQSGVYFLQLVSKGEIFRSKIIIQ